MNCQGTSDTTGGRFARNWRRADTARNRYGAWRYRSRTGANACWGFPRCWTALSSKPSHKSYKCNGSHTFIGGATDSARSARRIRPCGNCSVKRFIEGSLRLTVNTRKSAVDHPWNRKFLGFTVSRNEAKLKVADQAIEKLKARIRELTRRTRGHRLLDVVAELRETLLGWKAYFGIAEVLSPLRDIDKWIRRKLRCYHWKQWGRAGYRELRRRGSRRTDRGAC